MIYLLIFAATCALACLLFIADKLLKDTKKASDLKPYVFKHVESLKETATSDDTFSEDGDSVLDLTGLSARAKKAIASTGAFTVADLEIGTFSFYLHNTKGIGPKTLAEINAWSVANYNIKITE
tara:strand:- start:13470 stop:13841 length:372 start_codon:yes stop_codon:yes gene_type:complete